MNFRTELLRAVRCVAAVAFALSACSQTDRAPGRAPAPGPASDGATAPRAVAPTTAPSDAAGRATAIDAHVHAATPAATAPCVPPQELSPLARAAVIGDLVAVRKALATGRDPNERNGCGPTPLMMAIGIHIEEANTPKSTADARRRRKLRIADLLLARGADVKLADGNGMTALHWAALAFDSDSILTNLVARLLKAGAPADPRNDHRYTPLMLAAQSNRVGVAQLLLAAGASPSAESTLGDTPVSIAETAGHTELVTLLRKANQPRTR